jgi:hypothetical protein
MILSLILMHVHGFGICLDNNNTTVKPKFQYGLKREDGRHSRDTITLWVGLQLECFSC